jgi:predicted RNA-binding protein with PUA domain
MDTKTEALRRLGGPVCAACSKVDLNATKQVLYDEEHLDWLSNRIGGSKSGQTVVMCKACWQRMIDHGVAERAKRAEQLAREAVARGEAADRAYREAMVLMQSGYSLSEARSMYVADLEAAMDDAAAWQVGNGIFGGRYE